MAGVDGAGLFRVRLMDGTQNVTVATLTQYPGESEFWIWAGPAYRPRANFDDFLSAFLLIFQMISTENWNNLAWDGMRATHFMAILFYIFVFVCGYYISLNLFLAILLDNFGSEKVEPEEIKKKANRAKSVSDKGGEGVAGKAAVPALASAAEVLQRAGSLGAPPGLVERRRSSAHRVSARGSGW